MGRTASPSGLLAHTGSRTLPEARRGIPVVQGADFGDGRKETGDGRQETGDRIEKREQDNSEKKAPLSITAVPLEQSALKTVACSPFPVSVSRLPSPALNL